MNDSRTAMAAAVAGGYLLGRTKKAKLAFAVGSYLVGRRVGLSPGQVLGQGLGSLQRTPQFQELSEQVRGELLTAGRAAVTAAANRRLTGLADTLRDRTDALTGEGRRDDGRDEHGDRDGSWDEEAPDEDAYFDEEDREEDRRPAPAPARKAAKKAAPRKAAPPAKKAAKKTASKKAAPAKRATGPGGRRGGGRA
ncbi:hypothetical protein OJ963_33055 [Streptomyces sp. RS2]|uniref:hypothetical protein n=1 Tax=Streptomyces sp. RS2 TaxID=1451205 RepID=UPI0021F83629|nr:hypothetical protein [Streptomyces sp. RS2]MCW1098671.1 hypothetical protein [Streptomyces sp. RS2]